MALSKDLVTLCEKLRDAAALADSRDSLEQACREAEARLASLRALENEAGKSITAAHAEAEALVPVARARAEQLVAEAERQAAEKLADCDERCSAAMVEAAGKLADLDEQIEARNQRIGELEQEETALGQSVAALRADLESLRKKILG